MAGESAWTDRSAFRVRAMRADGRRPPSRAGRADRLSTIGARGSHRQIPARTSSLDRRRQPRASGARPSAQLGAGRCRWLTVDGATTFFSPKTIPQRARCARGGQRHFSELGVDVQETRTGVNSARDHANRPTSRRSRDRTSRRWVISMHASRTSRAMSSRGGRPRPSIVASTARARSSPETGPSWRISRRDAPTRGRGSDPARWTGHPRPAAVGRANGSRVVTLADRREGDALGDPWCELMGRPKRASYPEPRSSMFWRRTLRSSSPRESARPSTNKRWKTELRRIVRRATTWKSAKKPEVTVVISRLS